MRIFKTHQTLPSNTEIINETKNKNELTETCKPNGKKKIALALVGLAAAGIATVTVVNKIQKGQINNSTIKTLKDIQFNQGIATVKRNGEKFSGTVIDTLKNGDSIKLEYADGIIQSSVRNGSLNIEKTYKYADSKLSNIITKFINEDTKREFSVKNYGHRITENGILKKECFNNSKNIVVNDFDDEFGILKRTTVLNKNTKGITKIERDASQKAKELRLEGKNAIETFQNGACKKAELSDGTIVEYNLNGDIIAATNSKNKSLHVQMGRTQGNKRIVTIKKSTGDKTSFIQDNCVINHTKQGDYYEYYLNGQLHISPNAQYRENGTLVSAETDTGSIIKYAEDGFSKLNETFPDGSTNNYTI